MEWFSASFPGSLAKEDLDGVSIIRSGSQRTVHLRAYFRYRRMCSERFDIVVDEVNTIPFLTPLWAGIPSLLLIYQLAREVWWYESPFPVNLIGYILEPLYLRIYRRIPVLTISESTASDLRALGFRSKITVFPIGVEPVGEAALRDGSCPTFVYVGRLTPSKRVHDIIEAFALFRCSQREGELLLLGDGSSGYLSRLRRLARRRNLADSVQFLGRVSVEDKHRRMSRATALLMASVREGWGLVVTEANACGTPAIVYNVPGLRDSVRNGITGLVVCPSPESMAAGMVSIAEDKELRGRLGAEAQRWSREFAFQNSASVAYASLNETVNQNGLHQI